jgi:hypothetical protein
MLDRVPAAYPQPGSPAGFVIRVRLAAPGFAGAGDLDDVVDLLLGAGAPLVRVAAARMSSGDAGVELDFDTAWSEPAVARAQVVTIVRARTSMDARFARWVIEAAVVTAAGSRPPRAGR